MKKILLFWIAMLCAINVFSETVTFNITVTLGKTLRIEPCVDMKSYGVFCSNNRYTISNSSGISINRDYKSERLSDGVSYNYYYYFDMVPLSKGNYTFTNEGFTISGPVNCPTYKSYTVIYNITVVDVESITIPSSLSLQKGQSYTFIPTITHPKAETTLQWASLNPSVATISTNGVVTTKQVGSTIISCTASNGVSASCELTVTPIKATSLSLSYKEYELEIGNRVLLEARVLPTNAENRSVSWTSSNESVAVVNSSGSVTSVGSGYANITATTKDGTNLKASCLVHVVEPAVLATSISLDSETANIKVGQTAQLTATLSPSNTTNTQILWTSSNQECVSVNENGIIEGITEGTATITATTKDGTDLSASCVVNVVGMGIEDYDNTIYAESASGCAGGTVIVPIKMKNNSAVTGFQFNMLLPAGFSITKMARGERVKTKLNDEYVYSFDSAPQADGSTFVLCYSSQNVDISGNDGEVALATIKIPEVIAEGDYTITLKAIELSKAGSSIITEHITSTLTVGNYIPGDANGDGRISVADLTSIASHMMGSTPAGFNLSAADANSDGRISVADLTTLADKLMNIQ